MFKSPCTISISGTTGSGKTVLTYQIINNKDYLFDKKISKILYAFSQWQDIYYKFENELGVEFFEGIPSNEYLTNFSDENEASLLILDDLMNECVKSTQVETIFTRLSHHKQINVIYINQNIYSQGKNSRSIQINTHYNIILRNPRDVSQIQTLARQTGLNKTLVEAYTDAVSKAFGYIVIDLSPNPNQYILKTHIFPNENLIVYMPK